MVENGKVYEFHPKCALSKCLDVDSGGKENGTNLLIWKYHRSNNQRFKQKVQEMVILYFKIYNLEQ